MDKIQTQSAAQRVLQDLARRREERATGDMEKRRAHDQETNRRDAARELTDILMAG